jgi:Na+/H+-translocating membrane pyrophosphatase
MINLTEFHGKLMAQGMSGDVFEVFTVTAVATIVFWNMTLLSGKLHSSIEKDGGSRFF